MLVLLIACSGCIPTWTGSATDPAVAAVGDSHLRQLEFFGPEHPTSTRALTTSMQARLWRSSVRGENGWMTSWIRPLIDSAVAGGAEGIIVVAGVNDAALVTRQPDGGATLAWVLQQVEAAVADTGPARCVVWPTLRADPSHPNHGAVVAINGRLRQLAAARPGLVVPEWGAELAQHPDWVSGDGVHFSPTGEAAFQQLLLAAMVDCIGPPGAPVPDPGGSVVPR